MIVRKRGTPTRQPARSRRLLSLAKPRRPRLSPPTTAPNSTIGCGQSAAPKVFRPRPALPPLHRLRPRSHGRRSLRLGRPGQRRGRRIRMPLVLPPSARMAATAIRRFTPGRARATVAWQNGSRIIGLCGLGRIAEPADPTSLHQRQAAAISPPLSQRGL